MSAQTTIKIETRMSGMEPLTMGDLKDFMRTYESTSAFEDDLLLPAARLTTDGHLMSIAVDLPGLKAPA